MKTIWKFKLNVTSVQMVTIPSQFAIIHLNDQDDRPTFWAAVDTTAPRVQLKFYVKPTGHPLESLPEGVAYVGTVPMQRHGLVWHVFRERLEGESREIRTF